MRRSWFLNHGSNTREKEVKKNVLRNNVWLIRKMIITLVNLGRKQQHNTTLHWFKSLETRSPLTLNPCRVKNIPTFASAGHIHSRGAEDTQQTGRRPVNSGDRTSPPGEHATCSLLPREPSKLRQSEDLGTPLLFSNWGSYLKSNLAPPGRTGPRLEQSAGIRTRRKALLLSLRKGRRHTLVIYQSLPGSGGKGHR